MRLGKTNFSHFYLAQGMQNIDGMIYHVNTKLQIKNWSIRQEDISICKIKKKGKKLSSIQ